MKKVILLLLVVLIGPLFSDDNANYLEITAFNGVNLRNGPSTSTEIIAKLPHGSIIKILGYDKYEKINGVGGSWINISTDEVEGYVFSRFVGVTDFESKFLYQVFLDQMERTNASDNYTFHPYSMKIIQVFRNYYVASYDVTIPKGQDGNTPRLNYSIYILEYGRFREVFQQSTWGYEFLKLLDINNDGYTDIVAKHGGCCGSQSYIGVTLGRSDSGLPSNRVRPIRSSASQLDEYNGYCAEDFYFDNTLRKYVISGRKKVNETSSENFYKFYFDTQTNTFIEIDVSN